MKKAKMVLAGALVLTYTLVGGGCATTKVDNSTKAADSLTTSQEIVDWTNRNLDGEAKPEWLKKLVKGNDSLFRQEFNVSSDYVVKYSVAATKSRDSAMAASRVNYNAMRAEELKTKVVSEAAATLNNKGYTEATSNAATLAKVDLTGHELVTQFYQQILTTNKETGSQSKEFLCYSVYKISKEDWVNTLKGFLTQVIPAIPDSDAQLKWLRQYKAFMKILQNQQKSLIQKYLKRLMLNSMKLRNRLLLQVLHNLPFNRQLLQISIG